MGEEKKINQLLWETRYGELPQGKPRVFFTCHPNDTMYFEHIKDDILSIQDCVIYYTEDMSCEMGEFWEIDMSSMNLVVIPITMKLLTTANRAMDLDYAFASEHHIPVLPIMEESGIDSFFSSKFGDMQYLSPFLDTGTEIPYKEKLKKYLDAVLVSDETARRIRTAFDAYVFLSYRKKDRKYANELMNMIHRNAKYRDLAIWYDEFLTPGENFQEAIVDALKKSELFALLVTPNLICEENYVHLVEYPMALEENKNILPVEMVSTDGRLLKEKFSTIEETVKYNQKEVIYLRLAETISRLAKVETDEEPEHIFLIGLAYLEGIDVEVNRERAIELITKAANANLPEATDKLACMYYSGDGVPRDWGKWLFWSKKRYEIAKCDDCEKKEAIKMANILQSMGKYEEALELNKEVVETLVAQSGLYSSSILDAKHNIAEIYERMGRYDDALILYDEILKIKEGTLGPEHSDVLIIRRNRAFVLEGMGRYEEAMHIYNSVLEIESRVLGDMHKDTVDTKRLIARDLYRLGQYDKSLRYYGEVIEAREKTIGINHPFTLSAKSEMAFVFYRKGNYHDAIQLYNEIIKDSSCILGDNHPDTLSSKSNLAIVLGDIDNYDGALKINKEILDLRKQLFGDRHPDTMTVKNNIAVIYEKMGRYEDALKVNQELLADREGTIGANHPDTMITKYNLASNYEEIGRNVEALQLLQNVEAFMRQKFGDEHPETLMAMGSIAHVYGNMGKYEEALNLYREVLPIRERVIGMDHPITLSTRINIAITYENLERYNDARDEYLKVAEIQTLKLGPEHIDTVSTMNNVAYVCAMLGEYKDALKIYKRGYKLYINHYGIDHPKTEEVKTNIDELVEIINSMKIGRHIWSKIFRNNKR